MKRIIVSLLLALCLLSALMLPTFAEPEAQTYSVSAQGVAFVSEMMSSAYTADMLQSQVNAVNAFIRSANLSLTQQQFDALVDFCVEYGNNMFTQDYQCQKVIESGNYTDTELANAFCAWVKDGGSFSQAKLNRRLRQLKLFLYDSYDGVTDRVSFRYVIYYANGGKLEDNTVLCYTLGQPYGTLPAATRSGMYFAGWYTAASGGSHLCTTDTVGANQTVYARWSSTAVENPNESGSGGGTATDPSQWPELPALKISEAGIQFIKDHEGFAKEPMWDYGQYSVGYGSRYVQGDPITISSPITEEEADYLLRYYLVNFEKIVDKLLENAPVQHTQAQYDAIISLTYNLGQQWMKSDYMIYQYIMNGGYDEKQLVNTFGSWCRAGGSILSGLCRRRMDEANLYLNGDYTLGSNRYLGVVYNAMNGQAEYSVHYYLTGSALERQPDAYRSGYRFLGWYTKPVGGTLYTTDTTAPASGCITLYAHWEQTEDPISPPDFVIDPDNKPKDDPNEDDPKPVDPPIDEPDGFADVKESSWYYQPVTEAVESGLLRGMSERYFMPDEPMTRAMLATVLYRMAGEPEVTSKTPFTDVPSGQWYSAAIAWAYENGVVNGLSETQFGLDENVTREQLVTMLRRYAEKANVDLTKRDDLSAFSDASRISQYACEALQWAVAMQIMGGDGDRLMPQGNATRAQCAKMLVNFRALTVQETAVTPSEETQPEATDATLPETTEQTPAVPEAPETATEVPETEPETNE